MHFQTIKIALAAFLATSGGVASAKPTADQPGTAVEIADAAARERGDLSQVLVLGTVHLSALPADFDTARFDGLLDRLAAWKPEAIATETLSGSQCDYLREYAFAYPDTAEIYCPDPTAARTALQLTGAQAAKEIEALLASPKPERPSAERRRLAALFLAIGEPDSALVQWLRLPADQRHADDVLTNTLVEYLEKRIRRMSEDTIIAAPLAARLGHERVYPVDDHTGDSATGPYDDTIFGDEINRAWDNPATAARKQIDGEWDKKLAAGGSVIEWYRSFNSAEAQRLAVQSDTAAAAASKLPGNTGRKYLAYWETRNLRMVANLRAVTSDGRRVLAIVGASHKPYYERYLGVTSDLEIADVEQVLAD